MRKIILFISILLFTPRYSLCLENLLIKKIKIKGQDKISSGEIKKVMSTPFPRWEPWTKLPVFNEPVFEKDIEEIQKLYQTEGYFNASVKYELETDKTGRYARIFVFIQENNPSLISEISINAPGIADSFIENIYPGLIVKTGQRFQIDKYETAKEYIEQYFLNNGYGSASVSARALAYKEKYEVKIIYDIVPGPFQHFSEINLEGNTKVKESDILLRAAFKKGGVFSRDLLRQTQKNIFGLNLFKSVTVTPFEIKTSTEVIVNIVVEEKAVRNIRIGGGYGSEEKFRFQILWTRYYFLDTPNTLSLGSKISLINQNIFANLSQPFFLDWNSSLNINVLLDREDIVSYTNEKIAAQARLAKTLTNTVDSFIGYMLEINMPDETKNERARQPGEIAPRGVYTISGLMMGLTLNTAGTEANIEEGMLCSLYFEPATYLLGSKIDYFKGTLESRLFHSIIPSLISSVIRFKLGFINPVRDTETIPVFKNYFSGGGNSVRGYGFNELGPKDDYGTPAGGQYLAEASVELEYPLYKKLKGVIFIDAGNVYKNKNEIDLRNMNYGAGTGFRYMTPVGSLGLDAGFPILENAVDFSRYNIYFSINTLF